MIFDEDTFENLLIQHIIHCLTFLHDHMIFNFLLSLIFAPINVTNEEEYRFLSALL